jgi:hypothetical protein
MEEKEISNEALSQNEYELIELMQLMFLAGEDKDFINYSDIDDNE